jgi:hypothetical protein
MKRFDMLLGVEKVGSSELERPRFGTSELGGCGCDPDWKVVMAIPIGDPTQLGMTTVRKSNRSVVSNHFFFLLLLALDSGASNSSSPAESHQGRRIQLVRPQGSLTFLVGYGCCNDYFQALFGLVVSFSGQCNHVLFLRCLGPAGHCGN